MSANLQLASPVDQVQLSGSVRNREVYIFCALTALVLAFFTLYTDNIWEDFFITFRHSQNLCEGNGLLYNPGERVHGFTSPLGVLVPAFCYMLTGKSSYHAAVWLFRLFSGITFIGAGLVFFRSLRQAEPANKIARWMFALLFVFDVKAVAFSMNGMETAIMLFFLGWAYYLITTGQTDRWVSLGFAWAGLMWTRPDGFVYATALGVAGLFFFSRSGKRLWRPLVKSACIGTVLYLPWFIWAWNYYGSPIPNTILAKANLVDDEPKKGGKKIRKMIQRYPGVTAEVFQPIYYSASPEDWLDGTGFGWLVTVFTSCLGAFSALYWLMPVEDRVGRMASLCFAISCIYLSYLPYIFPWYMPFAVVFGLVAMARGITTLSRLVGKASFSEKWALLPAKSVVFCILFLGLGHLAIFGLVTAQMKVFQSEIEMGNRFRIGSWLSEQVRPSETVYLEPLGYIGYFSQARMIDWPGLVSPLVVRLTREKGLGQYSLIPALQPDWVIFRIREVSEMLGAAGPNHFLEHYTLVKDFDVTTNLDRYSFIPGRELLSDDACYMVFKRTKPYPNQALALEPKDVR